MNSIDDLRLSRSPSVLLSPVEDGYLAYDTNANRLHELNAVAALLVELFDDRTMSEVLELARPLLPDNCEDAVRQWTQEAVDAELLCNSSEASGQPNADELTAAQLVELAGQLRDEGKVQAAFLCQQQAVELDQRQQPRMLRQLGELAHITGKRDAARTAYEQYLNQCPDDAEIRHLLTSLRDDAPPDRVPNACIQQLYERFSSFYEDNMCDELGYEGPKHLADVIAATIGDRRDLKVLDLGCGTGLAGAALSDRASRIVGVDLSPEMIDQARQRDTYDELHVAEVTDFLSRCDESFDLIMACDTLIYFGNLTQVLTPAAQRLNPNGLIAISVELGADRPFRLTDNGRYVHHPSHIQEAASVAGLAVQQQQPEFLRMEYGEEVTGLYVTLS